MAEEWLSYSDLGERLNISPEAVRQRAIRARWPRRTANDGKAQVKVDVADVLALMPPRRANDCATPDQPPIEALSDARTIDERRLPARRRGTSADPVVASRCVQVAVIRFCHPTLIVQCAQEAGPSLEHMIEFVLAGLGSSAE